MHTDNQLVNRMAPYLFLAFVAIAIVVGHTPVGAALSMDSLFYLATADNILDGNGIVYETFALSGPTYQPMAFWPPLYPIILAAIKSLSVMTGISEVAAVGVFNFVALIVSLFLIFRIASLSTSTTVALIAAIVVALSPSLQIVYTYVWTEVLFIPLCLAAFVTLQNYLADEGSTRNLAFTVLLLGIATYTRYVGLAFFAAAALAVLLYGRGNTVERFRAAAVASLAYLVILAPMFLRNLSVSGALSGGERGTPEWNMLADAGTLSWYLFLEFVNLPILVAAAIGAVSIGSFIWLLYRHRGDASDTEPASRSGDISLPFLFAGCYLAFLLVARSRQTIDLDSRMLSVAVPFLVIGFLKLYQYLRQHINPQVAALPFLLPLAAFSFNAWNAHSSIQNGWRELGEPGPVLGLTYHSISGRQLDPLRSISEYFAPSAGDLVLTDIRRPLIVQRLFPGSDVRRMPDIPDESGIAALRDPLKRNGIAIVSSAAWSEVLSKELEGRADFFRIESQSGGLEFIVIQLPVGTP